MSDEPKTEPPGDEPSSSPAVPSDPVVKKSRGPGLPLLALVVVIASVIGGILWFNQPSPEELTKSAQKAFRRGEYKEALELAAQAYEYQPNNRLAMIAGESSQKLEDNDGAMKWYRRLEEEDSEDFINCAVAHGLLCMNSGRLVEAEEWLKKVVDRQPENPAFNRYVGSLLNLEGRRWEASEYFFGTLKHGVFAGQTTLDDLLMLANFEAPFEDNKVTDVAAQQVPQDPLPQLGRVQVHFVFNRYEEGIEVARKVIEKHPNQLQAHAWLGRGLVESGNLAAGPQWHNTLPANADDFPPVWHARGLWAARVGQKKAAARCFWEAVRREPNFGSACYQLGLTLFALNRPEAAKPFVDRHAKLSNYHETTHPIYREGFSVKPLRKVMRLAGELGRPWEEFLWTKFLIQHCQQKGFPDGLREELLPSYQRQLKELQNGNPPQTLAKVNPALTLDLSDYPLPDWSRSTGSSPQDPTIAESKIRFEDVSEKMGLNFTFFHSTRKEALRIFEITGGGVAAMDYDLDGWQDFYFTQAGNWPIKSDSDAKPDTLFRSIGGESVVNTTELSGLGDLGYTQGVTAGDINSDGFPDLYIGNLGQNRLYHNNGDGTFTEVSRSIQERPNRWTTSVLIADLNLDGLPDIYDVNYLSGETIFTRTCGDKEHPRACGPSGYEGEQDDVYLNNGDGTFAYSTETTGLKKQNIASKGLGILAADFDGTGQLNLFVGNDGVANNYLIPNGTGSDLTYTDAATKRGVALDYDARGQACMGIACDDFDGNERLDLYVTNFLEDSNTLYSMVTGNMFEDKTREAKLRAPSFNFLGFGTQAIDANLDGMPDLVLTNGHIDDFEYEGKPFRMRPQFYQNLGSEFVEVAPPSDSEFMNNKQLGRGLARVDFDRDGRMDFAVNHLDTPSALARNTTPDAGHFLNLRLVGIESVRDAIGTTVTVQTGKRKRTMQLTAGDGYHASNEKTLNFGLGTAQKITRMIVQWPSGVRQTFNNVAVDTELIVREDDATLLNLPR